MKDGIFKKWIKSYPGEMRNQFHKDGIINPKAYRRAKAKILFVVKEPNSKNGNYDKYRGVDLREIWGKTHLKKPFDRNIARWTNIVLTRKDPGHALPWSDVAKTMNSVAIINLKKIAGSGVENREEVCLYSFKDRKFLKDQISMINPDVIFACGKDGVVARMVWRIMNDNICYCAGNKREFKIRITKKDVPVYTAYHPSLRLKRQERTAAMVIKNIAKRL